MRRKRKQANLILEDYDEAREWLNEHDDEIEELAESYQKMLLLAEIEDYDLDKFLDGALIYDCVVKEYDYNVYKLIIQMKRSNTRFEESELDTIIWFQDYIVDRIGVFITSDALIDFIIEKYRIVPDYFMIRGYIKDLMYDDYKYVIEIYDKNRQCLKRIGFYKSEIEAENSLEKWWVETEGADDYDVVINEDFLDEVIDAIDY